MPPKKWAFGVACVAGIAAFFVIGGGHSQTPSPNGFDVKRLQTLSLTSIGVEDRSLRMSRVTVSPGASLPAHSHADLPEIIYILEGHLTEQRNDALPVEYGAGSVLTMTFDVTHALSNRGDRPAIYIAAGVPH